MGSTSTDPRSCCLRISEDLFRLTTESLRLHSNATFAHQTLAALIDFRSQEEVRIHDYDLATLGEHLRIVPGLGEIALELELAPQSLIGLLALQASFSENLGAPLDLEDALSLLLFDYVAERKANKILQVLEIDKEPMTPRYNCGSCH